MGMACCAQCGATYENDKDSCSARFDRLLALDHGRQEPWGSRHGQAFAAYVLQHAESYPRSLDAAWTLLYRIYVQGLAAGYSVRLARAESSGKPGPGNPAVPRRSPIPVGMPEVTIADLEDFEAQTYPAALDAWCRASLKMWTVSL